MKDTATIIGALVVAVALFGFFRGLWRSRVKPLDGVGDDLGGGVQGPDNAGRGHGGFDGGHAN